MDEMTVLRASRPAVEPPATTLALARAQLIEAAETAAAGHRQLIGERRHADRGRRRAVGTRLLASAAVAAAAITIAVAPWDQLGNRPTSADAATVLHRAADAVRALPFTAPRPDQFLYLVHADGRRAWLSMDGTHDGLSTVLGGGSEVLPGCRDGSMMVGGNYAGLRPAPCSPDPAYLPALPTDGPAMLRYLTRRTGGRPGDAAALNSLGKGLRELLQVHYLSTASRAAVLDAAALIPGVRVQFDATDPDGRRGTEVSWTQNGDTTEFFFDPSTYLVLGESQAVVNRVGQLP